MKRVLPGSRTVVLLVETSRAYGRGICRGVARFAEQLPKRDATNIIATNDKLVARALGAIRAEACAGLTVGSFFGSLLMGNLVGALTILGVDVYWNSSVIGATLLLAVLIDTLGRYRRKT